MVRQVENGLPLLFAQHLGGDGLLVCVIVVHRFIHLFAVGCYLYHLAYKFGDVVGLRQYQHHFDIALSGQHAQQFFQLVARLSIQSDEWVVHDEQLRIGKECLRQLELPQLAT